MSNSGFVWYGETHPPGQPDHRAHPKQTPGSAKIASETAPGCLSAASIPAAPRGSHFHIVASVKALLYGSPKYSKERILIFSQLLRKRLLQKPPSPILVRR